MASNPTNRQIPAPACRLGLLRRILLLLVAGTLTCAANAAATHPNHASHTHSADTLSREGREKMLMSLIESVNQLSKTADKLTEATNRLLSTEGSAGNDNQHPASPATIPVPTPSDSHTTTQAQSRPLDARTADELSVEILRELNAASGRTATGGETQGDIVAPASTGRYVWIPDSRAAEVQALLEGRQRLAGEAEEAPLLERKRVLFRGDTIPVVMKSSRFGRFDRKLSNFLAMPRGLWYFSLTASYGEFNTQDMELFDLLSDINLGGHIFSIKPAMSYFVRDNLAVGLRLSYTNGKAALDSFKAEIDDDMNFDLHDIHYRTESYQAGLTLTRYQCLGWRNRFSLTNEVELGFASGNSTFRRPIGGELRETHTTQMKVSAVYSPGLAVKMMDKVSFNISFGVFGFHLRSERQTEGGVKTGSRTASGANFRFNIFNINFGIGVQI